MTARQVFDPMMRTARVLYAALVTATLLLAGLSLVVQPTAPQPITLAIHLYMAIVAVLVAVVSFVVPAKTMATASARVRVEVLPSAPGPDGSPLPARFADPTGAARRAMAIAQQGFILSLALSEAISLLGFALHMLGAPLRASLPFFVTGTVLAALRFPTLARFVAPFERAHRATFAE